MSVFYQRWLTANALAEALGLGTTFALGNLLAPSLQHASDVPTVLLGALAAVVLGMLLEGIVVGFAQESVLRREVRRLRPRSWVVATSLGAGLAWLIGMVPSTLFALSSPESGAPAEEPDAIVQYALAAAMGLVVGPILGSAQWVVLKRHLPRAFRWLGANALAWAVGMPVIFLGMDAVPWTGPTPAILLSIYLVCGVAGLVVGAIHGWFLERWLRG